MTTRSIPLALVLVAGATVAVAGDADALRLVPFPKEVRRLAGTFPLGRPIFLEATEAQAELGAQLLNDELQRAGLKPAPVRAIGAPPLMFRLTVGEAPGGLPSLPAGDNPESYALEVWDSEVVCVAGTPAGLHHGLQTLCQLIRANRQGNTLPYLSIRDSPSLRWRCFQDDLTRGPSSRLETLKFEAALASSLKLNLMTFYMEYESRTSTASA